MQHLSQKQITEILNGATQDIDLKNILLHVESCTVCQSKIPVLEKRELFNLISREPVFQQDIVRENKASLWNWNWQSGILKLGFASALVLIFSGLFYLSFNDKKELLNVQSPTNINTISPTKITNTNIISEIENISTTNSPENTKTSTNNNEVLPQKQKKTDSILNIKPQTDISWLDQKELALNLSKIPESLADLESPNVNVRGDQTLKNQLFAKYPKGEVIRENQPVLRWNSVKNATSYLVSVYDENYNELYSKVVTETSFKVENPLKRGEKYQWQVKAITFGVDKSAITLKPTMFRVANDETIKKIDKIATSNGMLWKKLNLQFKEGMISEAEKTLAIILSKNPKDKLAIKFLRRINSLREKTQKPPTETKPAQ